VAIEARFTLSARSDGARDDALADLISGNGVTERGDDAYGLVTDDTAAWYRIFTLQDVNVGSADGRGCHPKQRVGGTDPWNRPLLKFDFSGLDEDRRFHCRPVFRPRHFSPGAKRQHGRSLLWLRPSPLICSSVIFVTSASKSARERFSQMCFSRRARSFRTLSSLLSRLSESG
jgi:hypothetical protein